MSNYKHPLRVGVGGPVGSGKTALLEALCKAMRSSYQLAVVTNDIYTKEDQRILTEAGALEPDRIVGVETGGCPHTAIREDASMNLAAVEALSVLWILLACFRCRLRGSHPVSLPFPEHSAIFHTTCCSPYPDQIASIGLASSAFARHY